MCQLLCATALLIAGGLPFANPPNVQADMDYPLSPSDTEISVALDYLANAQTGFGSIGEGELSAWVVMALAAAGEDASQWSVEGGDSIVDYLRNEAEPGSFGAVQFAVMILTIVAAGEDPYDFDGFDYVDGLISSYEDDDGGTGYTQIGNTADISDDLLGILALVAAGEAVDNGIVDFVREHQNEDGGWHFEVDNDASCVDSTALAVLALISEGTLLATEDEIDDALGFIKISQNSDGGFPECPAGASNVTSTAVVIMALHVIGEDPSNPLWANEGVTPVEYLLSEQHADGAFGDGGLSVSDRVLMTAHAIPALLGKPYPVPAPDPPQIDHSPSRLDFEATEGGSNPSVETLEIWNSGDGRLWWRVSSDVDWLSLSPSRGDSIGEKDRVTVSVDIDGLDAGRYRGYITIEDEDDRDHYRTVTVYLDIETDDDDEINDEDENGDDEDDESTESTEKYLLVTSVNPPGAGTISKSTTAGEDGYEEGTVVTLTAQPIVGFAFIGWSGHTEGSEPTATVTMDGNRSVTAEFLRFDASGLGNVGITQAAPDIEAVIVVPYPVEGIPTGPSGFRMLSAYIVQPAGEGEFTLAFEGLGDADNVAIFRVVDGVWAQIPRMVMSDTSLQVTLEAEEDVVVLAYPGESSTGMWERITGSVSSPDTTTIIVIVIAAVMLALTLVLIFVIGGRYRY